MAKIAYTKLALNKTIPVKEVEWNGQKIEIERYLPIEKKLDLIDRIINKSVTEKGWYNSCSIDLFTKIEVILTYTNITVTDKQKEDVYKLYDSFVASGFLKLIMDNIPGEEMDYITINVDKVIKAIYTYKNSVMGVLDVVSKDYSDTVYDAQVIQDTLGDKENLTLLRNVLDKLD